MLHNTIKPWQHRASASTSALTLASMLENGYDTDAWCGLSTYRSQSNIGHYKRQSLVLLGVVRP